MPDSAQVRSAVDAAEQAATAGDFHAAARHLQDALALQERELGPTHPDVASTLNNLGVVCERTGDYAEAERCYRRACEIVTAAFPPEHPFVETSRHNLEEFCKARALPVDVPPKVKPAAPPPPAPAMPPRQALAHPPVNTPAPRRPAPSPLPLAASPAPEQKPGRLALVPVIGAAAVVIAFVLWFNRGRGADISTGPSAVAANTTSAPPATPMPTPTSAVPEPAAAGTPKPAAPAVTPPPARPPASDGSPAVVEAQLCRALTRGAQWTCARASNPASAGQIYFYTRVTTARNTTIVHRWYRDDRVQLTRELPIEANVGAGYRTYSHLVLDAGSAGQWRVELTTADGRVLREERFVVR